MRAVRHARSLAIPAIALAAAALSTPACTVPVPPIDADPGSAGIVDAACDSAYQVLCGASGEADDARGARQKEVARALDEETLAVLSSRRDDTPPGGPEWLAMLDESSPATRTELERLFRKVRAEVLVARVSHLQEIVVAEHERLRALAIARVAASDVADRDAVLERLARTRLAWIDIAAAAAADLPRRLVRGCGQSLLVDDAWVDKSSTEITYCPGFLLVSSEDGPSGDEAFRARIAFIVAHEIGHVIAGATSGGDAARAAERTADRWATEIVAAEVARIDGRRERERYLRWTVEAICYVEADPLHGSGAERVERVARDPVIARALPCAVPPA